nr:MAG TPA: crystallin beta/gamma motif-containing protein [Caudoviricetes sp.]
MSQNPFMSVEKKGVLSPSTNPFMGITLEDSDFEQSQEVSPDYDQIEAVASGDLSATGYEPDPQVIAEFQRVPQINIPEEAFAGYVPDTSAPDFSGLRVSDTAFESYAPERMGQPSDEAQALVSSLAGNFNRNAEMVFSDAEYAAQSESQQRRRQVEADLAQDLDLRARTVAETFPNPLPAVELSNKTGIPVGTVLENHREIARVYDAAQNGPTRRAALEKLIRDEPITGRWLVQQGAAMIAGLGDQLPEIGAFERLSQEMQEANRVGRLQIEQTDLLNKVFWQDNPDPADLQRIDQINWELSINQAYRQDESFLMGAYRSSFSTFVPQVAEGVYRSILGGAQAGAAAGIATSAFGPISGVSAGSAFAAGAGAAGIRYAFEMSLGEIYGSLSQLKDENGQPLPRDEVRLLSFLGALPSGALEVVGVHKALSLIPGADKLLNRATVASAQQLLSKNPSLLKAVGKGAGEALGALATEVGVETMQEGISIITEDAAKQISGQPFRLTTGEEAVDRLSEAAYEALKAFVLPIGVGGGAIRTRAAFRESRQARNESNALQTLADHASNNKLITESPTAAEQLVSQLKEEGKIGDLYVNPEAMQRVLFQSDEGLQIAQRIGLSAEDVADALALGTRVAVPMEKAVPYLLNTAQGKELLQDSTLDPSVMTPGELQEATAGMTQEQIAQVDALNSFFDFVDSSIEQAQNSRESFDRIAAPYVQQMRDAGYSESQARHYGDLLAANAERMAPMYGMEPAAWLESRLQGIQLIDPNAPAQDVLDARAQRAFARQPLAEKDPLLALVWGRLDGKTLSSSYNADTLKEITRSKGLGLFKSKEKGGISIDELADEAVRRGLLPEGSGADELVERLKQDNAYHQFIDPARVQANPNARDVVPVLRRVFHMNTMELDDSKATVTVPREEGMSGPLTDIYQHDALYELYPELLDAQYEVVPEERLPGKLAGYSPKYGTIYITTDPDVTPSVIAHEVQHAIQDVDERFDFGLSEEASQEVYSQVEQELKGKLPLERARALAARIQYLSQAHEIQAFDTQNRFELTADERAKYEPNNPSTYYQIAYHGTPYKFDKFTLDNIGAGEGAQAHGWGLYFAENKKVSEDYRERLRKGRSRGQLFKVDIPENDVLIDEQKKFDEQSDAVKQALRSVYKSFSKEQLQLVRDEQKVRVRKDETLENKVYSLEHDKQEILRKRSALKTINAEKPSDSTESRFSNIKRFERGVENLHRLYSDEQIKRLEQDYNYLEKERSGVEKELASIEQKIEKARQKVEEKREKDRSVIDKSSLNKLLSGMSGDELYNGVSIMTDSPRAASETLNAAGIKGITYEGGQDGRAFVVFDDEAINILNTYYQRKNENNIRGKIEPTANGKWLISVFKGKKNLSTVIHETGHFFLENLRDAAVLETAPDWVKNDWAAIKGELGIKDDGFIEREAHEKFARQFEAYAREGKAPRPELQSAFNQFRAWLTAIYRSVRRLLGDAELSADVRAVFDRLLASEEDIASARKRGAPEPVIERASEALGIPTERLSAYREAVSRGMQKGQAEIALRRMREQKQVEYEAREEARDFIESAPFYRGMRDLSMSGGIDWQSLIGMATEDLAWQLREKWNAGRGKNIVQQRGGMTLDDAAAYLGVRDGTEVLAALMNEPTAREYTETHVRSKVAEWEKVYSPDFEFVNDAMDEALRVEIESLGGNAGPTTKQLRDLVDKRVGVKKGSVVDAEYKALTAAVRKQKRLIEEAVREVRREERATATGRVKNERANQRWSDAAKNARIDELRSRLAQLKEEERLKRAALGAAYRARIERNQTTRQIRRIAQSKSIPDAFKQQILSLVAHFPGLGTERMAPRPDENRPTLLQFQEALGVDYSLDDTGGASPIASWIFEEAQRQGPRRASDLSLSELRDVYDAIKILARQGRTQDALIGMLHEQELNQAVAEAVAPMASLSETKHITADERNRLPGALRSWFRDSLANMKVMRYLFDAADGYRADHDGPNSRLIVQPLQRAASQEQELFRSFGTSLRTLLEPITSRGMHKTFSIDGVRMLPDVEREFGGQWTMERVLSVALNMGNDGNLAALQRGYNWNTQDLELITRRMTSAEWRFVQSVWDLIDKLYPVINATYQQLYGVPLRRVEAKPFTVVSSDGETIFMRGGYYSLRFDKRFSEAAQRNSDFDDLNSREDILRTPNPRSGMTQERKGAGLPPLLSLSVLTSYVADAIHYGTHTLPLLDAYRIVKRPEYRRAMQRAFGDEAYAQVVPWLRSIARPDRTKIDGINKMFEFLARRGSLAAMGFSFRTALLQTMSIPQSMAEVGTGAFLRGAYHMLVHPLESWGTIRELSPYMVSRSRNMERDVADRLKPFREGTKIFGSKWEEAAFAMIQAMDAIVAYPTWMAKYNDAIGKGIDQAKAITLADDAVIRAQGSGLTMDTTALMRKPGAARLFTMFMSFAMNWQNRQRYYLAGFRESLRTGQSEIGTARFLSHFALEWLAPPILTLLLIGMGRDGEFPELEDIGSELLGYWLMGVPIVREIPALFEYNKKFGDSAAFKGLNAAVTATRGGMKIAAGEASDEQFYRTMKSTLDAIGFVAGVPTAPIWRTVEGTEAFIEGKAGPLAPILGAPPKDKQKRASAF